MTVARGEVLFLVTAELVNCLVQRVNAENRRHLADESMTASGSRKPRHVGI